MTKDGMYFPEEHLVHKLKVSDTELREFEEKRIVQGISKAGHVFYSRETCIGSEKSYSS